MDYKSQLKKALTASSASGTALIPEDLEPLIRANLLELSPLTSMIPVIRADGNIHRVVRRTAHNSNAWFEGEMTDASYSQSTYARRSVEMKILRTHGQASDFQVSAARSFTDVMADEIESATEGLADLFEYSTLWGVSDDVGFTGDAYQYTGLYGWLLNDAAATNVIDSDAVITLTNLDNMLDITMNKYRNVRDMQWVFIMSPQMNSKVTGLQTLIRRAVPTITFEGGFEMETYRGVPILKSGFVRPASTTTSPAVTAAVAGTGGGFALGDGLYRYKIASVTLYGEQLAGTADSDTVTTATHDTVDLTWTADANAKLYAIYRTLAGEADDDDNYDLIDVIAAKTYNSDGSVNTDVDSYSDTGLTGKSEVHPLESGEEVIFLAAIGQRQGMARPVLTPELGEPMDALVNYVPLVETTDSMQFRLKSYHAVQVPWGSLQGVIRRAKLA
jgi:hypothetical protein